MLISVWFQEHSDTYVHIKFVTRYMCMTERERVSEKAHPMGQGHISIPPPLLSPFRILGQHACAQHVSQVAGSGAQAVGLAMWVSVTLIIRPQASPIFNTFLMTWHSFPICCSYGWFHERIPTLHSLPRNVGDLIYSKLGLYLFWLQVGVSSVLTPYGR